MTDYRDISAAKIPSPDSVVISYISPTTGKRVSQILAHAEAREFWAAMSYPLRETAIIRPAELEDFEREDASQ
jgi:hypothetical protein